MHFIYVMGDKNKERMLALGYNLVRENISNNTFVFENKPDTNFDSENELERENISFVLSNMLTF